MLTYLSYCSRHPLVSICIHNIKKNQLAHFWNFYLYSIPVNIKCAKTFLKVFLLLSGSSFSYCTETGKKINVCPRPGVKIHYIHAYKKQKNIVQPAFESEKKETFTLFICKVLTSFKQTTWTTTQSCKGFTEYIKHICKQTSTDSQIPCKCTFQYC